MLQFLLVSVVALASCSPETDLYEPVAMAPTGLSAPTPDEPGALSRRAPSPPPFINHVWDARFSGDRGDVPRELNLERGNITQEFLCSRTVGPDGQSIVALNTGYADLRDAGEVCWSRVVSGGIGDWLEVAPNTGSGRPKVWTRLTEKLPAVGAVVGVASRTTVTANYDPSANGPPLTLYGWSSAAELLWSRTLPEHTGWPRWSPDGLMVIETQGADFSSGLIAVDPATGDVVATTRLDPRLQRVVNDPWALVRNSRAAGWSSDLWPPNSKGDIVSNGLRAEHRSDSHYSKYDVYDVETGDRIWGASVSPTKDSRQLFVEVQGPWLLVSIVRGLWSRGPDPWRAMTERWTGVEVSAYELATGKAIGRWSYQRSLGTANPTKE